MIDIFSTVILEMQTMGSNSIYIQHRGVTITKTDRHIKNSDFRNTSKGK